MFGLLVVDAETLDKTVAEDLVPLFLG